MFEGKAYAILDRSWYMGSKFYIKNTINASSTRYAFFVFAVILTSLTCLVIVSDVAKAERIVSYNATPVSAIDPCRDNSSGPIGSSVHFENIVVKTTGTISYDVVATYRHCGPKQTRAFALVGDKNLCPRVGRYASTPDKIAYDCIKYIGSPKWSNPSGLTCDDGANSNYSCTNSNFSAVERGADDPNSAGETIRRSFSDVPIPGWSNSTGNNVPVASGHVCQYYKTKSNGDWNKPDTYTGSCIPMTISVSWRERSWNLTPAVSVSHPQLDVGSTTIPSGSGNVYNSGDLSQNTAWAFGYVKYPAGSAPPAGEYSNSNPQGFFGLGWNVVKADYNTGAFPPGNWSPGSNSQSISSYNPGDRICWTMSVSPSSVPNPPPAAWRHAIACTVIGVKPKIQVLGYDVLSGGKVAGSTSNISGKTYGSWGQQGVFSTKTNVNVASGARLKDGNTSASQSSWSELTFANNTPTYGNYGTLPYPDDTVNKLKSGCTTLPPGDIGNGGFRPGVYCSTSDVTITNNITNPSGSATVKNGSFKQMVIIAPNIIIKDNVTNVDAWLIAGPNSTDEGIVSTCLSSDNRGGKNNPSSAALDAGMCNKKLTITGPVISRKLYLYRTYYDRTKPDDSAEVINVRPDAFLWAYEGAVGDTHASDPYVETQNVTELPPRL